MIDENAESTKRYADHDRSEERFSEITVFIEIIAEYYQRPVLNAPESASDKPSGDRTELLLKERIHDSPPPCLFAKARQDLRYRKKCQGHDNYNGKNNIKIYICIGECLLCLIGHHRQIAVQRHSKRILVENEEYPCSDPA